MITWVQCGDCEEMWCNWHHAHTADCTCPSIELWDALGLDPYGEERPVDIAEVMQQELDFEDDHSCEPARYPGELPEWDE